jgi:hypothetical protein
MNITPRLRHAAVAWLAVLALGGLSACGGNDKADKASDSGSAASSATTTGSVGTPAAGSTVSAAQLAGLFKAAFEKASSAHVSLTSTGSTGIKADGDADYSKPVKVQMTMTLPSMGQAEVRLVDNVLYLKLAMLGDKYVKVDLNSPDNPLGPLVSSGLDPSSLVDGLEGAITKATYVGRENVDGDQLDHYSATVDTDKLLAAASSALPSNLASQTPSASSLPSGVPATTTYDMWFDAQGYFRQMGIDLGDTGAFTAKFSNWGEKVDIEAPPADEVTDMPSLPGEPPSMSDAPPMSASPSA